MCPLESSDCALENEDSFYSCPHKDCDQMDFVCAREGKHVWLNFVTAQNNECL